MSLYKFILKSLWYFRRQHLAVFAGTILSTAVLTGALIIGDSVKYSLRQLVESRLGNTEFALLTGDRFVRAELAKDISNSANVSTASILMVKGIAINNEKETRINSANILGVENSFWQLSNIEMPELKDDEAIISTSVADKLNLNKNDEFLLRVENADIIPLNAPFVSQENNSVALRLTVKAIAGNEEMGRFSFKSNQATPSNIFISRKYLSDKLELSGLSNAILVSDNLDGNLNKERLNKTLNDVWQLADAGIEIKELNESGKYELLSKRIFIDQAISESVKNLNLKHESVLTYLVNSIKFKENATPYSFVTAASQPLLSENLTKDEIIINEWLANDLKVETGDTITLNYFIIGPLRTLVEENQRFIINKIIANESSTIDNSLMPSFPGLSDAGNCRDWETGIPIDLDKIRDKDEEYWNKFKGTPKALVSLQTGLNLWNNQFGNYTAFRFDKNDVKLDKLENDVLSNLKPADLKLVFSAVHHKGIQAVNNSVDFGELFLSLSFFVIAAGILLTILLYSLNTEARKQETGILSGLGFSKKQIIKLRFAESAIIIVLGGIAGSFVGILYNYAIMAGLNSIWVDVVRTNMLQVYLNPVSLVIGAVSGIIIALFAIYMVSRKKLKQSIVSLVKETETISYSRAKRNILVSKLIATIGILGAIVLVTFSLITSVNENAGLFLSAGALFILGFTFIFNLYFKNYGRKIYNEPISSTQFALKNAARNKNRSLATIILLALGTFTIIVTGANRKTFYGLENQRQSGTGAFLYWAETTLPLLYNLNTDEGKSKLGLENEKALENVHFIQFHSLEGDDASCLNLNQVQQPQILGVDANGFAERNAFSFAKLLKNISRDSTWLELNKSYENNIIPAFADQTVITWGLKKSIGDTLIYLNEQGEKIKLLLVGSLNSSIFQGNILIANNAFSKHFPSASGSKMMLIEADQAKQKEIAETLNMNLADYGIQITKASDRLAEFNSVTNTYLTVFMALGGLGVLIGTFGLGIVLLRNMLERKKELALLLAVGYKKTEIFKLIFIENLFLLLSGLIMGIGAAIIGILPSILSPSFNIPGTFMIALVLMIFFNGLLWIYLPARASMKNILIKSLSAE